MGTSVMVTGAAFAQTQFVQLNGTACPIPAVSHCPDKDCSSDRVIYPGPTVEMKSRRTYFLDYPCDLKADEKVTLILSLHGGGSYANWQRHYFPLVDYKDKYRLVIATPSSPIRVWTEVDDEYLRGIVESVLGQIGKDNIKSFWLVGHSQGGMTSNRLLRTEFFSTKVDGFLSLSGGRIGGNPERASTFAARGAQDSTNRGNSTNATQTQMVGGVNLTAMRAALLKAPETDFSFIYATGQRELDEKGLPSASSWAEKYHCGARLAPREIQDIKAGYVYDVSRQNPPNPAWGLLPAPGKAQLYVYPNCADGKVVADVVRLEKGHTEGHEPVITEELIKLMLSAPGGKLRQTS